MVIVCVSEIKKKDSMLKDGYSQQVISSVLLFTALNMRILKFKSQLTIVFFTAVNHLNGPLIGNKTLL